MVCVTDDPARVQIAQRATDTLLADFKEKVREKYGQTRHYAGFEFERMARYLLDMDDLGEVRAAVDDLRDVLSAETREKKRFSGDASARTTTVTFRIHERVRARLLAFADDDDHLTYRGAVDMVLSSYVSATPEERVRADVTAATDALDEFEDEDDAEDDRDTTQRIIDRLSPADNCLHAFRLSEFVEAADAEGIGTREYALSRYLPRVLDRGGLVPIRNGADPLFMSTTQASTPDHEEIDPRLLPYEAMDDADKRLALKITALEKAADGRNGRATLSVEKGRDILGGKPQTRTVRTAYQEIGETDGFDYTELRGPDRLVADVGDAQYGIHTHETALRIVGLDDPGSDPSAGTHGQAAADGGGK